MKEEEIRAFILERIGPKAAMLGLSPTFFLKDPDLLKSGILDSISFIEMIGQLETRFNVQIDFERISPGQLSSVSKLVKRIAELEKNGTRN